MEDQQIKSYNANYCITSTSALSGNLFILDEYVYFKPNRFNIGETRDIYIPIKDVCGYKKGFLTILYIYLNNGMRIKLAVWKKDEIINAIEEKRYAIYNKLEQVPPRLTMF